MEPAAITVNNAPCGALEGVQRDGVATFRGVPFALAARWDRPERIAAWSGLRKCANAGPVAPQNPSTIASILGGTNPPQSEDCLTLNIDAPSGLNGKRPVMVWVHGGAFVHGSGSSPIYNGRHLAETGDVIVVTINYRLGAFGFLRLNDRTNGAIASGGREGIADQIAALTWVRDNIAAFGGDPDNVTIFGESAGAMSVACLLASPRAKGLFHKAILQSGSAHLTREPEHADRVAHVFLKHLDIAASEASKLHNAPVDALLKAQAALIAEIDNQLDPHNLGTMPFQPAVDGSLLLQKPIDAIRGGAARGIPIIAGTTTEEWKLWTAMDPKIQAMDEERLTRWTERMFGDEAFKVLAAEPHGTPYERYVAMQTARVFREPTLRLLAAQAATGAPVFEYAFDWRSPIFNGAFGACHAMELGFVFGTHGLKGADQFFGAGPEASALANAMMQCWTSFAHAAIPSAPGLDAWPQWTKSRPAAMVFGADSRPGHVAALELDRTWGALPDAMVGS
jgi:para-nitrobenzyl esterase